MCTRFTHKSTKRLPKLFFLRVSSLNRDRKGAIIVVLPLKYRVSSMGKSFQNIILALHTYWTGKGCALLQGCDVEVGAGTFHWATTLKALGPESWNVAYVQPSRRPTDGRYGENPSRLQQHYQYQVLLKPSPEHSRALYLESLRAIGINCREHDIRFVTDDWESPTLGAMGLGWEVWIDGMEVSQFTYFQQMCGMECKPVCTEITYGLERLAMYVQGVENVYDLKFSPGIDYGQIHRVMETQYSTYNFEMADTQMLFRHFEDMERECRRILNKNLVMPAFDQCLRASHIFNLLDARGVVSATQRPSYIARVRNLAKLCAKHYINIPRHGNQDA